MYINKNPFLLILLLTNIFWTISCANTTPQPPILDLMTSAVIAQSPTHRAINTLKLQEENRLSFSVIYVGNLDEIMMDEESDFRLMVDDYAFNLKRPFQIDGQLKGITLEVTQDLDDPIEVAKEISQIEEVMMVEVKNYKKEDIKS